MRIEVAGSTQTSLTKIGESAHTELRGIEGHGKFNFNEHETLVKEATEG